MWEEGSPQDKEVTVHWDDDKEVGVVMREKESSADYRYFPEPDIPPLHFEESEVSDILASIGEMPEERKKRYLEAGLSENQAVMLTGDPRLSDFFDTVVSKVNDYKKVSSVVLTQLMGFLKAENKGLSQGPGADEIIELLNLIDGGTISANAGKAVLEKMVKEEKPPKDIVKEGGMQQISDSSEIESLVKEAMENNPKAVEDFLSGNEKAKAAIIGFVMGKTKGQADPRVVDQAVVSLIKAGN